MEEKNAVAHNNNWPRAGTIAHAVLTYLLGCKEPVTERNIAGSVAHTSTNAVGRFVYRALVRMLERELIYIVPIRVRGVVRRGFVAVGSPADATIPPTTRRHREWKAAGEL